MIEEALAKKFYMLCCGTTQAPVGYMGNIPVNNEMYAFMSVISHSTDNTRAMSEDEFVTHLREFADTLENSSGS